MTMTLTIKATLAAIAVTAASFGFTSDASAITEITLKDGTVLKGDIVREGDQFVILLDSTGIQKFVMRRDISTLVRDAEDTPVAADNANATDTGPVTQRGKKEDVQIPAGATRIAFVSLHESVGSYFNTDALERSVDLLKALPEEERPEVLVLEIDSGGGALIEQHKIIAYIRDHVEPEFRTVAWIESAISAAAMTAWVVDEVYMMRKAPIGGCTGYYMTQSGAVAMEGAELEEELVWMERVSTWGKKEPLVMRAMQIYSTLSADINPDGSVTWYPNDQGEYMISPENEVLTLNAHEAKKFGIAQGIADTKDQLAQALGCVEWVEVGQDADEMMVEFRANVKEAELEMSTLFREMNIALQAMMGTPEVRNKKRHFGTAKNKYQQIQVWAKRKAPSLMTYGQFNQNFFDVYDERFEQWAEQLAGL